MAVPLNLVCAAMRVISADSAWYSVSRLARSPVLFEPFCACTASSRMRCSASVMVASAPSAVCASEMPSLALRIATLMPRICAFMRSAMARPAASSLARVDAQARGQALHRGRQRGLRHAQVALSVQRHHVGVDRHRHEKDSYKWTRTPGPVAGESRGARADRSAPTPLPGGSTCVDSTGTARTGKPRVPWLRNHSTLGRPTGPRPEIFRCVGRVIGAAFRELEW